MPDPPPDATARATSPVHAWPDHLRYLVVEGVIGVGKTSLATLLAERFNGQTVFERFDENPFLPAFYEDPERWGFHTQLSFLASRFRQQKALLTRDLFHGFVIADYTFDKDRIFAHLNLQGDELHLYESLYQLMEATIPQPDLVVYLRSTVDRLLQNIAARARPYEQRMDPAYLASLVEAYDYYFARYTRGPLLIVDATDLDFVGHDQDLHALIHRIVTIPRTGISTFDPTRS